MLTQHQQDRLKVLTDKQVAFTQQRGTDLTSDEKTELADLQQDAK